MRLGIVGSRTFTNYEYFEKKILRRYSVDDIDYIISGGAEGVDSLAELFAKKHGIVIIVYKPNWTKYGNKAGAIRNKQIVDDSDKIIAFWDGESPGTKITIDLAKKAGMKPKIIKI